MKAVSGMLVISLIGALLLGGCSPKSSEIVVLEVGASKVSLSEYENFFTKNSGGWEAARKSSAEERERFLDLLTNYKLKLQDAYDRDLLNDSDIVSELREYRTSLASTFMLDKELTEPGVQQLYKRRTEEIRAQHILLKVTPDATSEETLKIYTKAMDLIRRAKAGASFDSLAIQNSEDPSVKQNNGDIYYFTAGQMVSAFENAAYAMHKGEISTLPTRSPFGYHIVKVTDRQPVRGSIRVSHIMARFQTSATDSADTAAALARVKGIQDSLKQGWDFHKLAAKLSEDAGSAPQGGDLGWFERRRFVQPFDEAAFKLKAGQTSGIVRTPFGYHVIHCDSVKSLPTFSQMRDEMKKTYQQRRYNEDYADYVTQMKKDFHYSLDEKTFNAFVSHLDSTKTSGDSAWSNAVPVDLSQQTIMMVSGRMISLDTVMVMLEKRQELRNTPLRSNELRPRLDRIGEGFLLEAKSAGLEQRYPDFASLMREYTDGIILYKAEQLEVWNRTTVSDSALKNYYSENKSKFMFPERVNISVLAMESDTLAYMIYDSLTHGTEYAKFLSRYKEDPDLKSQDGSRGFQPVETDGLTKQASALSVGDISEPLEMDDGRSAIVKVIAKEPARQKTYEEAGAEISNQYQEHASKVLEQQWLEKVKQRHPVKQYKEALRNAFSSPQASTK
ncbi:MAG: peptidylprolyl isomerase [Ignavibacteria bacterium]|nr:peptidylprolyl isomerase [Ignavibacteria bacterium]